MRSKNTFGVHFIIRPNQKGNHTLYVRVVVNKSKAELGLRAVGEEEKMTLNKLVASHNEMMQKVLERGL